MKTFLLKALTIPGGMKTVLWKTRTIPGGIKTVLWSICTIPGGIKTVLWNICTIPGGIKLFSARHTQYQVVWIYPSDAAAGKVESWGPGVIPDKWGSVDPCGEPSKSRGFQGGQWRRAILESWCYTRRNGAASIQAESRPIPENSRWCSAWLSSREGGDVSIYTNGQQAAVVWFAVRRLYHGGVGDGNYQVKSNFCL